MGTCPGAYTVIAVSPLVKADLTYLRYLIATLLGNKCFLINN